ncbi:hypothetical protein [Bacillus sp. 2205SS5-2]|uniref:hypothetical protein n=1 Tax=Bacillus sp. 2205SS5-2 TaxID=3109031 RepID=UPI003005ABC9
MKNSEVMPASLEGYSFDPEPQATAAESRNAKVAAQGPQASGRTRSESRFTQWADKCPSP